MSIGSFQEKVLSQKGCSTAIAIGAAFVVSFFIFSSCSRSSSMANGMQQQDENKDATVVTIQDVPVKLSEVKTEIQLASQRQPDSSFTSVAALTAESLSNVMRNVAYGLIAKKDHIEITDDAMMKAYSDMADQQVEMAKMQLKLKPDASKADVDAAFKKQMGSTPDEIKKKNSDSLKKVLADSSRRPEIIKQFSGQVIQAALTESDKPSDAEVKSNYDNYAVKKIVVSKTPGTDAKAKAEEALKAVQGGMSFEAAIDKYSGAPSRTPGKKPHDDIDNISKMMINFVPSYKVLDGQKVGFVSPVTDLPEGETIFKITAIKNEAPKDFDTNKEKYRKDFIRGQVQQKLQEEVKSILDGKDVKWDIKGYELISQIEKAYPLPPTERDAALQKIIDQSQEAMKDETGKDAALIAWFEAETALYQQTPDKTKVNPGRIAVLNAVLESNEDYTLRMELTDLEIKDKKGSEALNNLVVAMQNDSDFEQAGQKMYGDLSAKADSLVKSKLVTQADLKPFADAQASWKKNKEDADKAAEEVKTQQEAAKAQDAANDKANKAEVEKQKKEAAKPGASPTPAQSTTTPPAPSGAKTPAPTKP